jgi:hypothetical protein
METQAFHDAIPRHWAAALGGIALAAVANAQPNDTRTRPVSDFPNANLGCLACGKRQAGSRGEVGRALLPGARMGDNLCSGSDGAVAA